MQRLDPVGKDEGSGNIERRLLGHSRESGEKNLFGMPLDGLDGVGLEAR
jgi:hypothetical protein